MHACAAQPQYIFDPNPFVCTITEPRTCSDLAGGELCATLQLSQALHTTDAAPEPVGMAQWEDFQVSHPATELLCVQS